MPPSTLLKKAHWWIAAETVVVSDMRSTACGVAFLVSGRRHDRQIDQAVPPHLVRSQPRRCQSTEAAHHPLLVLPEGRFLVHQRRSTARAATLPAPGPHIAVAPCMCTSAAAAGGGQLCGSLRRLHAIWERSSSSVGDRRSHTGERRTRTVCRRTGLHMKSGARCRMVAACRHITAPSPRWWGGSLRTIAGRRTRCGYAVTPSNAGPHPWTAKRGMEKRPPMRPTQDPAGAGLPACASPW